MQGVVDKQLYVHVFFPGVDGQKRTGLADGAGNLGQNLALVIYHDDAISDAELTRFDEIADTGDYAVAFTPPAAGTWQLEFTQVDTGIKTAETIEVTLSGLDEISAQVTGLVSQTVVIFK